MKEVSNCSKTYKHRSFYIKWYDRKGCIHRGNNKPADIYYDKNNSVIYLKYYKNGILHRDDGPAIIEHRVYNNTKKEIWKRNGKLFREDSKSFFIIIDISTNNIIEEAKYLDYDEKIYVKITFDRSGYVQEKQTFINNKDDILSNSFFSINDEPTSVEFYPNGNKSCEIWDDRGQDEKVPTEIYYNVAGQKIRENWQWDFGDDHKSGIIYKEFYGSGVLKSIRYNDLFYNNDLSNPLYIHYFENQQIKHIIWGKNINILSIYRHRLYYPSDVFYDIFGNISHSLWFINNIDITNDVFEWIEENNIPLDKNKGIPPQYRTLFKLKFL